MRALHIMLALSIMIFPALVWDAAETSAATPSEQIALVDPSTGLWTFHDVWGNQLGAMYYGNPGDFPIIGDWDCDGDETLGSYRQSDGYVYLRNANSQGIADTAFFFGNPGDIPIVGDFDADGCDTVSVYRPSQGQVFIINELGQNGGRLGAADFSYFFGNPGDRPFIGDFDGDGIDTVGLHRESTGLVYFRNSHTQGAADHQFTFGDPGDRLVAGDWTGTGVDTPALFRPGNSTMYLRFTNTAGNADEQFVAGQSSWIPVAGTIGTIAASFGAGTWIVGNQVPPGTYRNSGFNDGCHWERVSGFSGAIGDVIAGRTDSVRQIVEIKPTDAGFRTNSECGIWSNDLSPSKDPHTPIYAGTWLVPEEIATGYGYGTWQNTPTGPGCYYALLSGFGGEATDIVDDYFDPLGVQLALPLGASGYYEIVGFYSSPECGFWARMRVWV